MVVFSLFMLSENSRNNSASLAASFRAENVAANIIQYQDILVESAESGYDTLHMPVASNPGTVEQITVIDSTAEQIAKNNLKSLIPFLNYQSVMFNYAPAIDGESEPMPTLYLATTWDSYTTNAEHGYAKVALPEVMGNLSTDLARHLYQGDSTYWVVPWVFSQESCEIKELYSQLPAGSEKETLDHLFTGFCQQIQANSSYKFMRYVYLTPIFLTPDM